MPIIKLGVLPAMWPLVLALAVAGCGPYLMTEYRDTIIGIEVALQPDALSAPRATAGPARVTLVRQLVRASALHPLSASVANVTATTRLEELTLRSAGYQSGEWNGVTGTAMVVDLSPELLRFQERIEEAVRPFMLEFNPTRMVITASDGSVMSDEVIAAVDRFVPESSGVNYRPHLIVDPTQVDTKQTGSQPSGSTLKVVGASVYQLGRLGTAERLLWTWTGGAGAREP
jgi:hypothetical protein